ncbi:hypothetical protein BAY60_25200 [Prauserella muralis]|uniref:Uncharacterized protein n=1 Tax=Prauserella muralis TaxID=588067 RepID=A0A2V4AMH4_9PSEU|nr:hypothetical protein BAY60_25200 [Prauserella muralis]TWE29837.1 CHAD domain-containing protein [Prauserella muralis]
MLGALNPAAGTRYTLSAGQATTRTVTYLDTVDWRLRRKGLVLRHERATSEAGTLRLDGTGDAVSATLPSPVAWPARIEHLPDGELRDGLADAMWVRAVAPVAKGRLVTREAAVLNEDGKIVVRLDWAELTGSEPVRTEPLVRVTVRPLLGYRRDAERVTRALRDSEGFEPAEDTLYQALLAAVGSTAEAIARPAISADMPADVAVATALLGFADTIVDNVDGVVDDVDTEFLHDLRVAVRRSRSLIKLAGDVLPERLVARHAPGFKWLGDVTTPTRDLDVYLLELEELAAGLVAGERQDLEPFAEHLDRERRKARRALVRALRSQRFTRLLDGWRSGLAGIAEREESEKDSERGLAARELVAGRLRRMVKKVTRRAQAITPDSPSEDVHDLRKRCKELRYLLEFAKPLCDESAFRAALKDLKKLQDILGDFQDGEVQSAALRVFAERMQEDPSRPPAATLLAMGELSARFVTLQRQARHDLTAALERFLGPDTQVRSEALLP